MRIFGSRIKTRKVIGSVGKMENILTRQSVGFFFGTHFLVEILIFPEKNCATAGFFRSGTASITVHNKKTPSGVL